MTKDFKIYHGRVAPFLSKPSLREMLDTVKEDLPEYTLFQVVEYHIFSLAGGGDTVRYLVMVKT